MRTYAYTRARALHVRGWNERSPVIILEYLAHLTEKESEEGEDNEVGAAGEVRQLVQLEGGGDREEDELHTDRDDRAHRQVILVQDIDRHDRASRTMSIASGRRITSSSETRLLRLGRVLCARRDSLVELK